MTEITIRPAPAGALDPQMVTPSLRARLTDRLGAAVCRALADHELLSGRQAEARDAVSAFLALYPERPVKDNKGGSQFNDSLWIFVAARLLAPRLIVESGVFQGHSSWLLRQACPEAEIRSFDIDLSRLVYRDTAGHLTEADWTTARLPPVDPADALILFDDHISQARRVAEAHDRGFRRLLFDDNFPAETLYATGGPPVPTIDMVLDPALAADQVITWRRKGKEYSYRLNGAEVDQARALIGQVLRLTELGPVTRHSLGSGLTLVDLVP